MKIALQPYSYFQGEFVPSDEAKISIATHAVQYGTAAFGGIRGYLDKSGETINIFRLRDHTRRIMNSAKILRCELPVDAEGFAKIIEELVERNNPKTDVYIRPYIYKSGIELSPHLKGIDDDLAVYMIAFGNYFQMETPLRLMVSSWVRIDDNVIPSRGKISGGYINSSFAKDQAEEAGYDDAIMLNHLGKVAEASGANLFIVRDGTLITTPVNSDILEGITRRSIMGFARDASIPVEERNIDRSELYVADEAFLCGTGAQVTVVGSIDGRPIGSGQRGPVTATLQELFFDVVRGADPHSKYASFLSKVPVRP
jgi:branched-chain amino acid aminotransferase